MATTYTDNIRIPHLDQNVAQPEIPENTAKDIIDNLLAGLHTFDIDVDAEYTVVHVDDPISVTGWQHGLLNFTSSVLTANNNVILPDNTRIYILINSTSYDLTYKTASGTGVAIISGQNKQVFCDGTNIVAVG